jgi:carbonic anhydrase
MNTPKIDNSITQHRSSQESITPKMAKGILKDGNDRFLKGNSLDRNLSKQVNETANGQFPFAAVLSCIDSRIPTEIIFDQGIGDIFNARIAGNFVNDDILGSLEFACKLAGAKLIVVLGHTSCGAVKGACDQAELGNLTQMLQKLSPAVDAVKTEPEEERNSTNTDFVNRVAYQNVNLTIEDIKKKSPVLNEMFENNEIDIVGAMYSVESGEVSFL